MHSQIGTTVQGQGKHLAVLSGLSENDTLARDFEKNQSIVQNMSVARLERDLREYTRSEIEVT